MESCYHNRVKQPLVSIIAVSYTHLDVYKRQRLEHARTAWHEHYTDHISTPMQDLLAPLLESYKLSATHLNNFVDISRGGPATVSYTHLDVYKRQLYFPVLMRARA